MILNVGVKPGRLGVYQFIRENLEEGAMRNREKQRELRRAGIRKEEKLDLVDTFGKKDPTPYQAVKNIIRKGERVRYEKSVYLQSV